MKPLLATRVAFLVFGLLVDGSVSGCAGRGARRQGASLDLRTPTFVVTRVASTEAATTSEYELFVGTTEITQGQWRRVMGRVPRTRMPRDDSPVVYVSWYDAATFANAMSTREGLTPCYALDRCEVAPRYSRRMDGSWSAHASGISCGSAVSAGPSCDGYRLPTQNEWLTIGRVSAVENSGEPPRRFAIYGRVDSRANASPVATRLPNEVGVYDTLGNVDEWLDVRATVPEEPSRFRQNQTDESWFGTASTCFRTGVRDLTSTRTEAEVGSWGRNCLGFRLVRTKPASTSAP